MEQLHNTEGNMRGLILLVLIMVAIALGAYTYLTLKEAQNVTLSEASISVTGKGEVLARPDIATFSFGVRIEGDDAGSAQEDSALAVNEIIGYLAEEGIDERDIKTQYYSLNPRYDYVQAPCTREGFCPPGERVLRGYEVNQTIQIKVRDVDRAGSLISGVGTLGATDVSSLQFTIDDEEELLAEAREKAIADAKMKAKVLAEDLDVKIVRVMYFYEEGRGGVRGEFQTRALSLDSAIAESAVAPSIPSGENTFTSVVNITYEIR